MTRNSVGLVAFLVAALLGVSLVSLLTWRSVAVERMDATAAQHNFEEARDRVPFRAPLVRRDAQGGFVRETEVAPAGAPPTHLHVLAYYVDAHRLVRADVPLWFFKVKGPALAYGLRGTGFDLETLGLTAGDLERAGARIVLDEMRSSGDRVLVWTE
jgi:hypothetical protein